MTMAPIDLEKSTATGDSSPRLSITGAISDSKEEATDAKSIETVTAGGDDDDGYPHGLRLAAIVMSLMLGTFLVALDNVSYSPRGAPLH
jgi:hypothetical protein